MHKDPDGETADRQQRKRKEERRKISQNRYNSTIGSSNARAIVLFEAPKPKKVLNTLILYIVRS